MVTVVKSADKYFQDLGSLPIQLPLEAKKEYNSYHTFVIQTEQRDELKEYLNDHAIETAIHYSIPIHLQPAARFLGYKRGEFLMVESQANKILTLPISQYLQQSHQEKIIEKIHSFFRK